MWGSRSGLVAAVILAAGIGAAGSPRALAVAPTLAYAPCADSNNFACGHVRVPIDPTGATPGTITLAVRRHRAPVGEARDAVVALAGGPGQAALPFAEQFASILGPIIATRDLIVFDQRGTGLSDPLSCGRLRPSSGGGSEGREVAACAAKIGRVRTFFTTAQSVADIEAIRQAGGYEKLVLYGTSYGTKVAERYAQSYPTHVEGLVLDSVVPPNGPDPLSRSSFAAVPRVLRQLCAHHACRHITPSPGTDLMRLVRRIGRRALRAHWIDGQGRPRAIRISSDDVLEALFAGDLEPALRAEFPAAVLSAARGDDAALARMLERAERAEASELEPGGFDPALDLDTTCEELSFPWNRQAAPSRRLAEAKAAIADLPASSVAPFARGNVLATSDMPGCAFWPYTTPAPAPEKAPLPAVPTLILSGADDLRTPTGDARELAAAIPGSHLLLVPGVGHSVLSADQSGCAARAMQALFAGKPIAGCPEARLPALLRPTPVPPARLADVPPAQGNHGRPGRTLQAVVLTLADLSRQLSLQLLAQSSLGSADVGGLRAGWAGAGPGALLLHGYSYVPGVIVSGKLGSDSLQLRVGGAAAAPGALHLGPGPRLVGTLGGQRVRVRLPTPGAGPAAVADPAARLAELTGPSR